MARTLVGENKKYSVKYKADGLNIKIESLEPETECLICTISFFLRDGRKKTEENIGQVEKVFYNVLKPLEKDYRKELKLFNDCIIVVDIPQVLKTTRKEGSYCKVELYLKSDNMFEFNRKIADAVPQFKEAVMAVDYFNLHILECIEEVDVNYGVKLL
jgi:hypothetical protein